VTASKLVRMTIFLSFLSFLHPYEENTKLEQKKASFIEAVDKRNLFYAFGEFQDIYDPIW
jgi:hypothetical protein